MATVFFPPGLQQYTRGEASLQVEPGQIRSVIKAVVAAYPDLGPILSSGIAVSLDGSLIQTPLLEVVEAESEVHLVPQISGG